jgi:ferric-dicitrate binding protein FerR (iron transport regulator)
VNKPCGRLWEIDALREHRLDGSDADSHARHRATCAECRARWSEDERLAALGRRLEPTPASELSVRRLRADVLRKAASGASASPSRRVALALAAATVLAIAIALVVGPGRLSRATAPAPASATSTSFASTVDASGGARWSRRREGGLEQVRLEEGTLALTVAKQRPGERFLVELPDGRIEVRGTRFEVSVRAGATESVRVSEGLVAWARSDAPELLLHAGESWAAPRTVTPAELPVAPVDATATASQAAPIASQAAPIAKARTATETTAASDATAIADEYAAAMSAYRAREYDDAARRFSAFAAAHPSAAAAEDAAFLEASALAHGGRGDAAANVAERFLARRPSSLHARDAAILVARAARDRNDCARARAALAPWSKTPTADVSAALGACKPAD